MKKHLLLCCFLSHLVFFLAAQNVGIGVTNPSYFLDVAGRMRVRSGGTPFTTAGIMFNKNNNTEQGFVGLYDDTYIGFFGFGASWGLVMNTLNGNVGIGTLNPTSRLNVVTTNTSAAILGRSHAVNSGIAVRGIANETAGEGIGGFFTGGHLGLYANGEGIQNKPSFGVFGFAEGGSIASGVYGDAMYGTVNYAGYFQGNTHVNGTLSKGAGSFKIDHPQDPLNKYLVHSFVESPDMLNVYNGNILTTF